MCFSTRRFYGSSFLNISVYAWNAHEFFLSPSFISFKLFGRQLANFIKYIVWLFSEHREKKFYIGDNIQHLTRVDNFFWQMITEPLEFTAFHNLNRKIDTFCININWLEFVCFCRIYFSRSFFIFILMFLFWFFISSQNYVVIRNYFKRVFTCFFFMNENSTLQPISSCSIKNLSWIFFLFIKKI